MKTVPYKTHQFKKKLNLDINIEEGVTMEDKSNVVHNIAQAHAILSKDISGVTLVLFENNGIKPNLKVVSQATEDIINEHLKDLPISDSLLISQMLLEYVYSVIEKETKEIMENKPKQKKLDFLCGYS